MNIGMRSQLDTSSYNGGSRGTSIGEALGVVQGVTSLMDRAKDRGVVQKEKDDNEYLDTTFGKHLNGWNGQDQNDFLSRIKSAAGEVLTTKPELYSKVTSEIGKAVKAVRDEQDQQMQKEKSDLEISGKKLENTGKEFSNNSSETAMKKADLEYNKGLYGNISYYLDAARNKTMPYDVALLHIQRNTNISPDKLNIPKTEQEFLQNPDQYVDPYLLRDEQIKKELDEVKLKTEKSGESSAQSAAKIAGVNADYIEREKQAGLSKTYADINKKKTGFDSDLINQVKEKMLSDPALNELIKLYAYGNISEQEMMAKMPGFGGAKAGDIRMAFTSAAIDLNPPQYDANQNLIGGFSPKQFSIARGSESGATRYNARMQDTKVTTANSAMVLINHVIDPQTEKITNMKSITPQFASELALNAARLVSPTGQVGIELQREFKQNTLQENVAKTLAYFGLTSAGTTEANLRNIKAFIKREGGLAQKTRDTYYSGEGNNVGFDSPDLTGGVKKPVGNIPVAPATSFDELWAKHGGK
jgi:hypothetical protein